MKRKRSRRVDDHGRAYAGSQLQVQIYVSRRRSELDRAVLEALNTQGVEFDRVEWFAPLEAQRFSEPMDAAFLQALGLARFTPDLRRFWPTGGPRWDALARLQPGNAILLVEGKSYPDEMRGSGCKAKAQGSRRLIDHALATTRRWAGADDSADWLGPLYQYANRLAHVYFLRETAGVDAWLANLCFLHDPHRTTTLAEWHAELAQLKSQLGFAHGPVPHTIHVFLPALSRGEFDRA